MGKQLYAGGHKRERREANDRLTVRPIRCRRCGRLVYPDHLRHLNWDGRKFDLGHPDPGQDGKQPEHNTCNRGAGGREGQRRLRMPASEEWW